MSSNSKINPEKLLERKPKLVVAVLARNKNKYLLIRETLEGGKQYWIVPGGKVEFGETIQAKWFSKKQVLKLPLVDSAEWLFKEVLAK